MAERSEVNDAGYYISSFSDQGGCVAVRQLVTGEIVVKHSRTADPKITFSPTEWAAFLAGVKAGEFDDLPAT